MKERYLHKPQEVETHLTKMGTDVILRKDIEEVIVQDDSGEYTVWDCYQAEFKYPGSITPEELAADFDYWYGNGPKLRAETGQNLSLEEMKLEKYAEISAACENTIYRGVDVTLSTGIEHFSLTEKDQINLFGKKMQMMAGNEKMEYHEDGEPCRYYSAEDMQKIIDAAFFYVSLNTTYCNALNMWIKGAEVPSDLAAITWGAEVPEAYQNEVLTDYLGHVRGGTVE